MSACRAFDQQPRCGCGADERGGIRDSSTAVVSPQSLLGVLRETTEHRDWMSGIGIAEQAVGHVPGEQAESSDPHSGGPVGRSMR